MWKIHISGLTIVIATLLFSWQMVFADSSSISYGLKRASDGNPPEIGAKIEMIFQQNDILYRDLSGKKTIYFTFDNGYEKGHTDAILDTLIGIKIDSEVKTWLSKN